MAGLQGGAVGSWWQRTVGTVSGRFSVGWWFFTVIVVAIAVGTIAGAFLPSLLAALITGVLIGLLVPAHADWTSVRRR